MTLSRICVLPLLLLTLAAPGSIASAASPTAALRDGTVITYHGKQRDAHLPLTPQMIPGAPHSFRTFVRHELVDFWKELGLSPDCKDSPQISVRALRTDGFALGSVGSYPQSGCPGGGGYVAFWAIRNGEWKQVIGTQDVPTCSRLEQLGFPSELGVHDCFDGDDVVDYTHA
jgi:hypothetical protein